MTTVNIELAPQDLELLQTAMTAPAKSGLGLIQPKDAAQLALGAICLRILAAGYRPRPVGLTRAAPGENPPANAIQVSIPERVS